MAMAELWRSIARLRSVFYDAMRIPTITEFGCRASGSILFHLNPGSGLQNLAVTLEDFEY